MPAYLLVRALDWDGRYAANSTCGAGVGTTLGSRL